MMQKNSKRPGYKKTEVGWIPQDWTPSTLGHSEHFLTSGSRGWSQYYSDSGELFVRITNLTRDSINLDYTNCRFVSLPAIGSEGTRTRLQAGDILISITADLGIIAYFSDREPYPSAYVNQHVALLRLLDIDMCPEFVAHQLASPRSQQRFQQMTDQGAKAGLNLPSIRSFPVVLPSLPEQEAIAEVLECWDKAIRGYERKIEKKRNIKKGLMQRLLTGEMRLPGFATTENTEGHGKGKNWIPEGWQEVRLGEICEKIGSGITPRGGEKAYAPSGVPLIRSQNVLDGRFSTEGLVFISADQHQSMAGSALRPNDLLFNITGASIGRCCLFPQDLSEANVNQHVCIVRLQASHHPDYMLNVLNSDTAKRQLYENQAGGAREGLNFHNLGSFRILLPAPSEQQAIAAVLSAADAEIAALERKLAVLREQKRFLLNNMVTGAMRLPQFCNHGTHGMARK